MKNNPQPATMNLPETYKPMDGDDWQGWAGAEQFPDGSPPLIGEIIVAVGGKTETAQAIISGDPDGGEYAIFGIYLDKLADAAGSECFQRIMPIAAVAAVAKSLAAGPVDATTLPALGFEAM